LEQNGARIAALVADVPEAQARWKPDADSWSIQEVLGHLLDEEREDFRVRLDLTLHQPGEPWPPIHPGSWVTERSYNTRDLGQTVAAFLRERALSVAFLRSLEQPDWQTSYEERTMPAGDLLASWVTHDLLHLRQIVELLYAYARLQQAPYSADYAGEW
jgi:uncharacterized damage-inducible protein DinB